MKELVILLIAIVLLILGIKGTYAGLWNKLFPNYPLTVAPPVAVGSGGQPGITIGWGGGTSSNSPSSGGGTTIGPVSTGNTAPGGQVSASNPTYNPVAAGQQAGTAARNWISGVLTGAQTGAGPARVVPAPNTNTNPPMQVVGRSQQEILNADNTPNWWPSWLPPEWWPGYWGLLGPATNVQTGKSRNTGIPQGTPVNP